MRMTNECVVAAPLDETWRALLDIGRVAGALPGAKLEPAGSDGVYRGSMRIKLGPVVTEYQGSARLEEVDEDEHVAAFVVRGREARGGGTASATIRNRLAPHDSGTRVIVETDLDVTGRPAQLGRGLMEGVAAKLLEQFAAGLERQVLGGPEEAEAPAAAPPGRDEQPAATPSGADREPAPPPRDREPTDAPPAFDLGGAALGGLGDRALPLVALAAAVALLAAIAALARRPIVIVDRREEDAR